MRRVYISRDVVIDEKNAWRWEERGDGEDINGSTLSSSFTIEHWVTREVEEVQVEGEVGAVAAAEEPDAPARAEEPRSPVG